MHPLPASPARSYLWMVRKMASRHIGLLVLCLTLSTSMLSSASAAPQAAPSETTTPTPKPSPEPFDEDAILGTDDSLERPLPEGKSQASELEDEKQAPPAPLDAQEGEDELSLEEYERDDWQVVRPRVALLDVGGYMRLRGDLFRRLDFDNGSVWEYNGADPLPRYQPLNDGRAQYSQVSMRLRIEPRLNVNDNLQIWSTVDVFDNMAFGQTPWTNIPRPPVNGTPPHILSPGQAPMRRGINSLTDNIIAKRLWLRATFLNEQLELRVGRMPDHFGLGMFYNNGDCLNCDRGTVVDRLALSFRALGHVFTPQIDWVSRGPMHQAFGYFDPYPTDAVGWDNALQYALRITKEDHPDDIRDRVAHRMWVANYGLSNALRTQKRDFPASYYSQQNYSPTLEPTTDNLQGFGETRDGLIYQGDVFGRLFGRQLEMGAEVVLIAGRFKDMLAGAAADLTTTHVLQIGAAAEATYHLREDRRGLRLDFRLGGASGDGRRGFGALDAADTQRGRTASSTDTKLHNFQFSPDYHIDMILFRRMIGGITDAWYLRPEVAYRFDDKLSGRTAVIYSQAMTAQSVPSATSTQPGRKPMGLEVDAELAYGMQSMRQRGQLLASLAGAMLFPFGAFDNLSSTRAISQRGGRFAWTLQARLYVTF